MPPGQVYHGWCAQLNGGGLGWRWNVLGVGASRWLRGDGQWCMRRVPACQCCALDPELSAKSPAPKPYAVPAGQQGRRGTRERAVFLSAGQPTGTHYIAFLSCPLFPSPAPHPTPSSPTGRSVLQRPRRVGPRQDAVQAQLAAAGRRARAGPHQDSTRLCGHRQRHGQGGQLPDRGAAQPWQTLARACVGGWGVGEVEN